MGSLHRDDDLPVFDPVLGTCRRGNAVFDPCTHVPQGLVQNAEVADGSREIFLDSRIAVQCTFGVQKPEMIVFLPVEVR